MEGEFVGLGGGEGEGNLFGENFGFETEERRARRVSVHLTLRRAERGGGRNGKGEGGNGRGEEERASGFRVSRSRRVGSWLAGAGYFLATPRVARVASTCGSKSDLLPTVPLWPSGVWTRQAFRCFLNFSCKVSPSLLVYQ